MHKTMKIIRVHPNIGRKTHLGEQWEIRLGQDFCKVYQPKAFGLYSSGRRKELDFYIKKGKD